MTSLLSSNPILCIDKYTNFERDVVPIFKNELVLRNVEAMLTQRYATINVAQSMKKLQTVGELLGVAYAGSKGFKCNAQVVRLLANYQTLGKDSQLACNEFLMASMKALQYHKMALQMVTKQKPEKAFLVLAMTSKIAAKMVTIADGLVTKAQKMCDLAVNALDVASTDDAIATDKKNETLRTMTELKAQTAELDKITKSLKSQVVEAREGEKAAAEKADETRMVSLSIAMLGAFAEPIGEFAKKYAGLISDDHQASTLEKLSDQIAKKKVELSVAQAAMDGERDEAKKQKMKEEIAGMTTGIEMLEQKRSESLGKLNSMLEQANKETVSAVERETRLHEERVRLQDLERKAYADLTGAVTRLKGTAAENDTIGQALASLDLAIKSLGRIKTVFENTRKYWETVQSQCDELADITELNLTQDMDEEFATAITDSWYRWLLLGKINYTAVKTMEGVTTSVDGIMDDLPTTEEAKSRLTPMFEMIDADMKQESEILDAATL